MKQKGIKKLALFLSLALVLALASGCSTSAGTNAALYFKNMSRILFSGSDSQGGGSTVENTNAPAKTEIASPADFAISDGNYSFTGVENAAQYLIYLCESGSTDDDDDYLYSGVIPASGLDTHSGTISDVVDHAYGTYTAKLFAVAADYTMSTGALAEYSVSGPLPEPELCQRHFKMSFFAEMECRFLLDGIHVLCSLIHQPTCRLEACQALIYQLVLGLTGKNGKYNYPKAVHLYPPFFDIFCSAKNYKIAPALTSWPIPGMARVR